MDIDDLIVWYYVLTEKPRPPKLRQSLGPIGWMTLGLLALTIIMIVARIKQASS